MHTCFDVRFSWNLLKSRRMRRRKWVLSAPPSSGSGSRRMADHLSIILIALCTSCEPALSALCLFHHLSLSVSVQIVGAPIPGATAMRVCSFMKTSAWAPTEPAWRHYLRLSWHRLIPKLAERFNFSIPTLIYFICLCFLLALWTGLYHIHLCLKLIYQLLGDVMRVKSIKR